MEYWVVIDPLYIAYAMQLANQTFYLAVFIVLIGLMARFLANKDDDRAQFRILYWPAGLSFLSISMLSFCLAPWGGKPVLAAANILLIAGTVSISMLFSYWNKSNSRINVLLGYVIFLSSSAIYLYLLYFGKTIDRIHLMNAVLGVLCVWQLSALVGLLKKTMPIKSSY